MRRDLARRQAGYGRSPRQQIEKDDAEILGGLRHGRTLGGPVALIVRNRDHANWGAAMSAWPVTDEELAEVAARRSRAVVLPRPGPRRPRRRAQVPSTTTSATCSSARRRARRAARVAAGAFAKALLAPCEIRVRGRVIQIGDVAAPGTRRDEAAFDRALASEVGCSDAETSRRMIEAIDAARVDRDTLGGLSRCASSARRPGLGSYTEPRLRLDARLAAAALGIQAMKGVEIGDGLRERVAAGLRGARRAVPRRRARLPPQRRTARAASRAA